jgi:signal transduction histidine kinase
MISNLLYAFERGFGYLRSHPQIIFALVWVIIIPLLFLYTGQKFLETARVNQDRLAKDKIGLMHDVFVSLSKTTAFNLPTLQTEVDNISKLNPEISVFMIVEVNENGYVPVVSLQPEFIGVPLEDISLFNISAGAVDTSISFELYDGSQRLWRAFRSIPNFEEKNYYIFTEHSLSNIDNLIKQNEQKAYWSLALVYIIVLSLAYWQIRNTNFAHLYEEAKKANATKDLFTNMIAHELRAPLTAIRGYASMVLESKDTTPANQQYADRIKLSTERLLTIVNDLLDVARIQSGKLSFTKADTDIAVVINAVADELRVSATEKNIVLQCTGTEVSAPAVTDGKRLHQAITNLVSNSIKYTKEGKIEISLEAKGKGYEIRIKDTGMGISAADQKNLFAPFYRVQSDDVSQITGTGLGMWITRQLLELMGAKIEVESIKGVGTHIVVTIDK